MVLAFNEKRFLDQPIKLNFQGHIIQFEILRANWYREHCNMNFEYKVRPSPRVIFFFFFFTPDLESVSQDC